MLDTAETDADSPLHGYLFRAKRVWADRLAGLLYYVALPFAAILVGSADFPIHLGLAGMDWPASVARGAVLGLAVVVGLAAIAGYVRRYFPNMQSGPRDPSDEWDAWLVALCQEAHWAFYRLPAILLTGDFLLGTFLGAALALLERVADPRWRRRAASADTALGAWLDMALLVGMASGFYFVRNFFVLWAVHAVLVWTVRRALR